MATQGGIADDLLVHLAEDIETGEQVEALGRTLGFSEATINRYTETNRLEGRVTCKGTRDMLFDWRQTVEPSYQHLKLKQALIEAKLVMLADTYLNETAISPDIHNKISESLTISQCREKLKNVYLNELCKIPMKPWDRNDYAEFKDMHTLVTMVKKDPHGKDTRKKEILEGSVSEIFSTKVNGTLPARILIAAPAGRGKTTAVAKIAYDWAHRVPGSALEHLPLLFVLKFRNTGRKTSIGEAIKSQLLSDVDDLTPEDLESFIRKNQSICHIILDGLDEYAGIAANKGLGSNIVDVMLWKTYRECRVLVTTRPHLESFFNQGNLPTIYTKMWIEGFSRESSREYIDKFFASTSNTSEGQGLKIYLDGQPLINELVITPLFCLMVCHLWSQDLLGSDMTTQTELLDSVNLFLMHHANARSKDKITEKRLGEIICKLGEVALTGLLNDAKKLVFTPNDFRKVPDILDKACELGIISKTTVSSARLPTKESETTSTTVEFYHKLAQEHSAGKNLADQTNKYLLRWKISKLDRVLKKIRENIGDYENLIRFAAGTENRLCIRIMEALLDNSFLDESERYRILLDCSSETTGTEQGVSSLVQRCVAAQRILLKSPTVYTVVGMQNFPKQLKNQVRRVRLERSAISFDVTNGLWSCLRSFSTLQTITISDSFLSFSQSPPELPSVTKLKAERVTSHNYEVLISSMPSLKELDVTIDDDVEGNTSQITASKSVSQSRDQYLPVRITLQALPSLSRYKSESREMVAELCLLIREPTDNLQRLQVTGMKDQDVEALINLFVKSAHVKSLNVKSAYGSQNHDRQAVEESRLEMKSCQLSAVMTETLWSCFSSMASPHKLSISDSSLSFPSSSPELTSVTELKAERVTSQSYEGLLSSIPNVKEIDITVGNAQEEDLSRIQTVLHRHLKEQEIALIRLDSLPSKEIGSGETMRGLHTTFDEATLSGVVCGSGETVIDLVQRSTRVMSSSLYSKQVSESLNSNRKTINIGSLAIRDCKLTATVTSSMWSCIRSFPSLRSLTISDSSLSFPPSPPELTSVTKLYTKRVTSQSYEGLLSSLPGLEVIDITMDDAERDISQITASLRRTGGQQLTRVYLRAQDSLPPVKKTLSRERMRRLGLLIREKTKNLQWLRLEEVKCTDEEDLVYLFECCRHVEAMENVLLYLCGTEWHGRLESYLESFHSVDDTLRVQIWNDTGEEYCDWIPRNPMSF